MAHDQTFLHGADLGKLLGLPQNTIWFSIEFDCNSPAVVTCEFYPSLDPDEQGELRAVFKQFMLVEIPDEEEQK